MTKGEIVTEIMDRLNLTSTTATTRIGRIVDRYYLRVTSAIGVKTISRRVFDVEATTTIQSAEVEFELMENITRVYYLSDGVKQFLDVKTIDELREDADQLSGDTPSKYAIKTMSAMSVTIYLDMLPESEFTLYADGYGKASVLDDGDQPIFPESFHDILVEGPLIDEYKKLKDWTARRSRAEPMLQPSLRPEAVGGNAGVPQAPAGWNTARESSSPR
jgi:hypothetical protein